MTVLVWIVLGVFGVALFLMAGALVEMYRSLEQIRAQSGALDSLTKLEVAADAHAMRAAGLPSELFEGERAALLVLSDRCSTCEVLAERLAGAIPTGLWILLEPQDASSAGSWLSAHGLDESPNVLVDHDESIANALEVRITPGVLRFGGGQLVAAHTVPSPRRLSEELHWLRKGGGDQPDYGPAHDTFQAVSAMTKRTNGTTIPQSPLAGQARQSANVERHSR